MFADTMPAAFVGHGSPMNALEKNRCAAEWRLLGLAAPRPRAILAISAHWYIEVSALTAMARPNETSHDRPGSAPLPNPGVVPPDDTNT